jgi:hypothetical protein
MVSILDDDYFAPALTGYQRVYSISGRLYYLPYTLQRVTNLQENSVSPTFRSRQGRPHRILTRCRKSSPGFNCSLSQAGRAERQCETDPQVAPFCAKRLRPFKAPSPRL